MELEHQALIYKYITVNAPIPSNLLIPKRKALETTAFCYPGANLRHTAYGWGGFHMRFSNNSDEKKWRCSRDTVADQKYCERHMNRGRHRSRKPVEGQPGHSILSPLRMGLGVGNTTATNVFDERSQAVNWIPVSWETSSGGPLGEVLNHNTNNGLSALNLMTDGWDSAAKGFGCFSNSSAGSSPRTDNSLVGSTLITSSLPLL
ncbi:putative transcription factor interactor and regulator C3H-WRC/GRF family [Helianthus annuus]|nr:growth-regulating factor 6 [Helianthus annuus]XP_021978292.1 growth-regulating factor 6 [Helianthus annuus]XP_035834345.1 growth-regulating factor 6 [Helianthus annuus]XP_035834346.1 growth-regulating factor 6 [Helianthus annuus]XP_035834347.1 growth-regulating factor 6 [Helianthus annuus]XP_035834350.1 growth-regulating factor 6 [Helianthus annuus]XP_035834351.1 growth-regulating factor 6 [Helianthus annuus]KAF5822593.1 putative transcription factor interactor and regulator C3H-WRC/GRF f